MHSADVILIIEAFMWLLMALIPLLAGLVVLSCWLRNRVHAKQQKQMEKIIMQHLNAYTQTGQWPVAQTQEAQKAMKMLAKRLDLHNTARHTQSQSS